MNLIKKINKEFFIVNEDLSNIFEKLNINNDSISPEMIDNIKNMFSNVNSNSSDSTNSNNTSEDSFPDIDMATILKIKSIMDKMKVNSNNPRSKLLHDLKPFLTPNKQNKIDQYIKMDKMIELLPLIGGDFNPHLYNDEQVLIFSLLSLLF